jgi:hypothetical protein
MPGIMLGSPHAELLLFCLDVAGWLLLMQVCRRNTRILEMKA